MLILQHDRTMPRLPQPQSRESSLLSHEEHDLSSVPESASYVQTEDEDDLPSVPEIAREDEHHLPESSKDMAQIASSSARRKSRQKNGGKRDPAPESMELILKSGDYVVVSLDLPHKLCLELLVVLCKFDRRIGGKPSIVRKAFNEVKIFVRSRKQAPTRTTWTSFVQFCKDNPFAPKDFTGCSEPYAEYMDVYKGEFNDDAMRAFIERKFGKDDEGKRVKTADGKKVSGVKGLVSMRPRREKRGK